jgi:hypothetical protein
VGYFTGEEYDLFMGVCENGQQGSDPGVEYAEAAPFQVRCASNCCRPGAPNTPTVTTPTKTLTRRWGVPTTAPDRSSPCYETTVRSTSCSPEGPSTSTSTPRLPEIRTSRAVKLTERLPHLPCSVSLTFPFGAARLWLWRLALNDSVRLEGAWKAHRR